MLNENVQKKPAPRDYAGVFVTLLVTAFLILGLMLVGLYLADKTVYRYFLVENLPRFAFFCLCVLAIMYLLFVYLKYSQQSILFSPKYMAMLCCILVVSFTVNMLFGIYVSPYMCPFALATMLITILINRKLGLFCGLLVCIFNIVFNFLTMNFVVAESWQITQIFIALASCTLFSVLLENNASRLKVVISIFSVGIPVMLIAYCSELMFSPDFVQKLYPLGLSLAGIGLTVLLYLGALPLYERGFNIITIYRLNELTDHNNKLLRKLKESAPGTFNHVLVVANLAEACALAIGEDPHFVRAAAYYHDIGKMPAAEYFSENQAQTNPHDQLTPELSVSVIKKHTSDGYALAKKYNLPDEIADVAREHHGTMPIKYFYYKALKFTDGELSIDSFRYPGPIPQTKAAALIMICDACEAAIRSLKDHSRAMVESVVRGIIEERMDFDQFTECDITMRQIYTVRDTIVDFYTGFYHDRVAYPKFRLSHKNTYTDEEVQEQNTSESGSNEEKEQKTVE